MTDTQSADGSFAAAVTVDADDRSDWSVSPRIFGAYVEHYGREVYPGIYAIRSSLVAIKGELTRFNLSA
jgi:alpha-L-arabinofuranosidase